MMSSHKIEPMHSSIVIAICQIKMGLDAVEKTQKNQHGGYKFASTDDVYAALTRRMGEVGLACLTLEEEPPKIERVEKDGKVSQWCKFSFRFVLATSEATWTDCRATRSLFIQITGPQTFQAAQSYAEKSWLRSLFKLPTGDMDLDSMSQSDSEDGIVALNGNGKKRKSSAEGKRDGSVKEFNELVRDIRAAISVEHLAHIREAHSSDGLVWSEMPERWHQTLEEEYEVRLDDLRRAAA